MKPVASFLPCVILLSIFLFTSVQSAFHESLTYDEIVHLQEGKNALTSHRFAIDTNNPPLERELAAVPLVFHITPLHSTIPNVSKFPERFMIILLSVILGLALFITAYFYLGVVQAYLALFLYIFDPNVLGNNHYVTFDIGFALFFFISYICLLKILENPKLIRFIFWGAGIGLGLASKVSFIPFFLVSGVVLTLDRKRRLTIPFLWNQKYKLLLTFIIAFTLLWATYFFTLDVIIAKRNDPNRVSAKVLLFARKHNNGFLLGLLKLGQEQRIPLGNYIAMIKNNGIRNTQSNQYFFLGQSYKSHKWYFMLGNMLFKTPLPMLFLFLIGLLKGIKKKYIVPFLIPIGSIIGISSLTNLAPWVRYILPAYPFMILIASESITFFVHSSLKKTILGIICVWYLLGTLSYYPHFISFTNELLSIRPKKELLFIDSNIDWGQGIPDVLLFLRKTNPRMVTFSYFGRDRGDLYGLRSNKAYGGFSVSDICAFHMIPWKKTGRSVTAISISNWYYCGFSKKKEYNAKRIKVIVGHSILIF